MMTRDVEGVHLVKEMPRGYLHSRITEHGPACAPHKNIAPLRLLHQ